MAEYYNDYVVKNQYSRPAIKLLSVKGIVIHYTANNGATAEGHQDFFDGSDGGGGRYAGAHIFVDRDSAVCVIPLDEVAYHANERACKVSKLKATAPYYVGGNANLNTIGIEMCVEKDGTLHPATVERTKNIVVELLKKYKLTVNDIYRHYDVTGKNCPAMWVARPAEFEAFKKSVSTSLKPVAQKSVSKPVSKVTQKSKKLTVKVADLYFYDKPKWTARAGKVHAGDVFTVVGELTVDGAKMYKLKSGNYITASTKYVSVK